MTPRDYTHMSYYEKMGAEAGKAGMSNMGTRRYNESRPGPFAADRQTHSDARSRLPMSQRPSRAEL